ncbi:MAG: GNAT family N-acetyltransferase [Clostridia bacterium]|nr:GNAT family N-acetyltransferase [Clostridia bacterium]
MRFYREITLADGEVIVLRSLEKQDAGAAIFCLRQTSGETEFLLREVSECGMTIAQEEEVIKRKNDEKRGMLLGVFAGDALIGMAGLNACGAFERVRHRASIGISLLRAYWGRGIGTAMMHALIDAAKDAGYEQIELDVVEENKRALALYQRLGFKVAGHMPRAMKYRDGRYAALTLMVLSL